MDNEAYKKANLKRIMALVASLLVIAVAITVVGISYAWFSDIATATIEPISLVSEEVMDLVFAKEPDGAIVKYGGQNAYDDTMRLVTERRATSTDLANGGKGLTVDSGAFKTYMLNAPYQRKTEMKFDTDGRTVDFQIDLTDFKIYAPAVEPSGTRTLKYPVEPYVSDAHLCGTWFMKKKGGSWIYTPYGKIDLADIKYEADRVPPSSVASFPLVKTFVWDTLPSKVPTTGFVARAGDMYEFYLVFAPEKLFWKQFCASEWTKPVISFNPDSSVNANNSVYTADDMNIILNGANGNVYKDRPFYATPHYVGDDFEFLAQLSVTKVY
ncbi:MAG: hypothetical protein RR405_05545 [Clostridia bacterium]